MIVVGGERLSSPSHHDHERGPVTSPAGHPQPRQVATAGSAAGALLAGAARAAFMSGTEAALAVGAAVALGGR